MLGWVDCLVAQENQAQAASGQQPLLSSCSCTPGGQGGGSSGGNLAAHKGARHLAKPWPW